VYDAPVTSAPRGLALPALFAAALLAAGCVVPESRRYEPRVANILPEQDPASRGTVQGQHLPLSAAEQLAFPPGSDGAQRQTRIEAPLAPSRSARGEP
jgi:hypothetical protein